jgi:hypothetical protein
VKVSSLADLALAATEPLESAARSLVRLQAAKTRGERLRRLQMYAFPLLGGVPVGELLGFHIKPARC